MASRALDDQIDRLYQLPLDEFTAARNALAKDAGADAASVRSLVKPPVAAWAVNQLFWRDRKVWDALIGAADKARQAHKAVLSGKSGDVRSLTTAHNEAVEEASKATLDILAKAGHPQTDSTRQAITTTLRALPSDEPPGRLTRALQPAGFEALAGLSIARGVVAPKPPKPPTPIGRTPAAGPAASPKPKADTKAMTRAREAVAAADRAIRTAQQAVQREEFEVKKAARDEERASRAVEKATEAVEQAQADLDAAQKELTTAARKRESSEKRLQEAEQAVTAAKERAQSADDALQKISSGADH